MLSSQSQSNLLKAISECSACPLSRPVLPSGPLGSEVMVIARSPGEEEARLGKPLVGPAGILFSQFMELCGLQPDSCYITNLVMCPCKVPSQTEIEACSKWKALEFKLIRPKLVILLGGAVVKHFYPSFKDKSIKDLRGQVLHGFERKGYFEGYKVVLAMHPGYMGSELRNLWGIDSTIVRQLARLLGITPYHA